MSGLQVAVAGGGLGGLCLAQGLLKAGVDVTVYERDAQLAARWQGYRLHVDARAGLALEQCLPAEQRRTGPADPYAPATLSTSVNRPGSEPRRRFRRGRRAGSPCSATPSTR